MIKEDEIKLRLNQIINVMKYTGVDLRVDPEIMINDMSDLFDIIEEQRNKIIHLEEKLEQERILRRKLNEGY